MHRALIFLPALLSVSLGGCVVGGMSGAPYSESQRHTYRDFEKVDVSAGIEVVVAQGNYDVTAETTSGENFDDLVVEVRGDTLYVGRKPKIMGWLEDSPRYRVSVSAPMYTAFDVSSGANLSGANLNLTEVSVDVSSGAHVELAGACRKIDADLSSGAHFDGAGLRCERGTVEASSGAHADAFVSGEADGDASSGANITFHGNPSRLIEDSSSGGSVSAR